MIPDRWQPRGDLPSPRDPSSNVVLRVLGCSGLILIAMTLMCAVLLRSGRSPDPTGSARSSAGQIGQIESRCAQIADDAAAHVADAERLGIFYKFEGETVYVGSLFYELPIDSKRGTLFAAWCDRRGGSGYLHVRDSRTGRHVGIVSRDGVSLDLD